VLEELKKAVCEANLELDRRGIVVHTWGNVSGIDRARGLVAIKPSGVSYDELTPDKIVIVDLDGNRVEGDLNPSTDTRTHLVLYRAFPTIAGVAHTHSANAVAWAQARREIPCFGTTHADYCHGSVPLTAALTPDEVARDYEGETGHAIVRRLGNDDPLARPMALVAGHGPFTWGKSPKDAVLNAVFLEEIARIATATVTIDPAARPVEEYVSDYHYQRKHGPGAWYGQGKKGS
jgi:L-ribulose-5-phosphate 4-epimerase